MHVQQRQPPLHASVSMRPSNCYEPHGARSFAVSPHGDPAAAALRFAPRQPDGPQSSPERRDGLVPALLEDPQPVPVPKLLPRVPRHCPRRICRPHTSCCRRRQRREAARGSGGDRMALAGDVVQGRAGSGEGELPVCEAETAIGRPAHRRQRCHPPLRVAQLPCCTRHFAPGLQTLRIRCMSRRERLQEYAGCSIRIWLHTSLPNRQCGAGRADR